MITVGQNQYRLCLLDTNFLSAFLKKTEDVPRRLFSRLGVEGIAYAVSIFTVVEVSRKPGLYDRLIEWFSLFPNVLLKNTSQLLEEEIQSYPDPSVVDPVLICPVGVRPEPGYSRVESVLAARVRDTGSARSIG